MDRLLVHSYFKQQLAKVNFGLYKATKFVDISFQFLREVKAAMEATTKNILNDNLTDLSPPEKQTN